MDDAYEIAKHGGRHKGIYERNKGARTPEIERPMRSLCQQIEIHLDKISNPRNYVRVEATDIEVERLVTGYWPKEILNFRQQLAVLQGILAHVGKRMEQGIIRILRSSS